METMKTTAAQTLKVTFNTCATDHKEVEVALKTTLEELGFRYVGADGGANFSERYILFERDLTNEPPT